MRDLSDWDGKGPSPYWKNHVETPAVHPEDPELDALVNRIISDSPPYPGYEAREFLSRETAPVTYDTEPRICPIHCAISLCAGLLIGFTASAILF